MGFKLTKKIRLGPENKFGGPPLPLLKNETCLESAEKIDQKSFQHFLPPSRKTCVMKNVQWCRWGAEQGQACDDPGARTPISASGDYCYLTTPDHLIYPKG